MKYNVKGHPTRPYIFLNSYKTMENDIKTILENLFDVQSGYRELINYVKGVITNEFLCKGISETYISNSFDSADIAIILGDIDILPNGNIFGLALLEIDQVHNSAHLSTFSSHKGIYGAGEILLEEINKICGSLFISKIHLESLVDAIGFYEKYGYVRDDPCMCKMTKMVKVPQEKKSFVKVYVENTFWTIE